MNPKLQESIDELNKIKKQVNDEIDKAAKESQDVKDGRCTEEDEKMEPGSILFNAISETTIKTLQSKSMSDFFDVASKELSDELIKQLVAILAISMTNSAYNAVVFYDELLKKELKANFDIISNKFNDLSSSTNANTSMIDVLVKRVNKLEQERMIEKIENNENVN